MENEQSRVVDALPGLVWTALPDGRVDFLNRRWYEFTGMRAEEAYGSGWQAAIHPDDLPQLLERWQSIRASGEPGEMEARLRRFDGAYRWFLIRACPLADASGRVDKWCGMSSDIEDRRQAEEKLRAREDRFRLIVDGFPAIVSLRTPAGDLELVNREFVQYSGATLEELKARPWHDTWHPDDRAGARAAWNKSLETGRPCDFEGRRRRADGVYRWFQMRGLPLRDADGHIVLWYLLQTDIDDAKRAEEALGKARSELAHVARVTTLGALTASIAHEVNQPLSGIVTNASTCLRMLAADPPNVDGARETARRTIRDGHRASEVITRLRALFTNKVLTTESVDLNEATREVIALSLSELQRSRVILRSELAEDLPPVAGDRVQLQQVILNLFLNASDAMSGIDDRPRQLVIRTERDEGDRVRLSVQDAGVGVEPQRAEKLFEAFYTTKSGGMGIGLSVSRSIIESHHGRLWAAPNDGPGATFSFSIPRAPDAVTGSHRLGAMRTPEATDAVHVMRNR